MHILKNTCKSLVCAAQPGHWLIFAYKKVLCVFIDLIISSSNVQMFEIASIEKP